MTTPWSDEMQLRLPGCKHSSINVPVTFGTMGEPSLASDSFTSSFKPPDITIEPFDKDCLKFHMDACGEDRERFDRPSSAVHVLERFDAAATDIPIAPGDCVDNNAAASTAVASLWTNHFPGYPDGSCRTMETLCPLTDPSGPAHVEHWSGFLPVVNREPIPLNVTHQVWVAMRKWCPHTCGFCPASYATGAVCDQVLMRHVAMVDQADMPRESTAVWLRLVSKAAFELGEEDIAYTTPFLGNELGNSPAILPPSGTPRREIYLAFHMTPTERWEAEPVAIVWLLVTIMASIVVFGEIVLAYSEKQNTSDIISKILIGVPFHPVDIHEGSAEEPSTTIPHVLNQSVLGIVVRLTLELGAIVGESVLPTHQAFPQWLMVDLKCIGTFERVMMVLLPRTSHLGITGVLFNSFYITPPALQGIIVVLGYVAMAVLGLAITLNVSMQPGQDVDTVYFFVPIIAQCIALLVITVITIWLTYNKDKPEWEAAAGLRVHHASHQYAMCMQIVPPLWVHVVLLLEGSDERKYSWVEMGNTWVQWTDDTLDMPNTMVVLAPKDTVRHFSVPKEAMEELCSPEMGAWSSILLSLNRLPRRESKKADSEEKESGIAESILENASDMLF